MGERERELAVSVEEELERRESCFRVLLTVILLQRESLCSFYRGPSTCSLVLSV